MKPDCRNLSSGIGMTVQRPLWAIKTGSALKSNLEHYFLAMVSMVAGRQPASAELSPKYRKAMPKRF
jgi:hypothetical protein